MMSGGVLAALFVTGLYVLRRVMRSTSPVRRAMHAFIRRHHGVLMRIGASTGASYFNERNLPERRYLVRMRDVEVQVWAEVRGEEQLTILEMRAEVAVPPAPILSLDSRGEAVPSAELEAAWRTLVGAVGHALVRCNGDVVRATLWAPLDVDGVAALADVVARVARHDGGLGEALLALPDATPLEGHALVPGVVLGVDGLMIGVRKRSQVVAQLDDVTHVGQLPGPTQDLVARAGDGELLVTEQGARFTWRGIERDPARLRAGVDALRSLRGATGPYR